MGLSRALNVTDMCLFTCIHSNDTTLIQFLLYYIWYVVKDLLMKSALKQCRRTSLDL